MLLQSVIKELWACVVVSLPVLMAGTTLGWSSPVIEYVAKGNSPFHMTLSEESWMITFLDIGNFIMAIPAGILTDILGRKIAVFLTVPITLAGWILMMIADNVWYLYVGRFLHGCAMAISLTVTPIYVGEMASVALRGSVSLVIELSYASGLMIAYVMGWLGDYQSLIICCTVIPVITGILMLYVPESPYYLMLIGKTQEAADSLRKLRDYSDKEFEQELQLITDSTTEIKSKGNLNDLFHRDRRPLIIVSALAVLQMACGASVMEAYASSVLTETSLSANACSVIFGAVIMFASVPYALTVDKYGRRPLYLVSCAGTTLCHIAIYAFLTPNGGHTSGVPLLLAICGSEFFINMGIMPLLTVVQCEYFPSDTRGMANSVIVFVITFSSTVMLKIYQPIADAYGKRVNFAGYALATFLGGILCYVWVPETKGKSFVQIQTDFESYMWFGCTKNT
ncbi:uncharacterized protein LOC126839126 isoform X2 [Adelges cooleyi]|uniref:uncharacterized protein LOC126839126 isoform X2 n=1 Tax=Adelges cooleyi TaxID=133065 RepID=UPI0021808860|nr:uncharacterized protein LOC126839126 isoform X2 [Adelges cooleyi]